MRDARLMQFQDDNWRLEITHESGIAEVLDLGRLTKEQAQREALIKVQSDVRIICFDKDVMKAIQENRLRGIVGL